MDGWMDGWTLVTGLTNGIEETAFGYSRRWRYVLKIATVLLLCYHVVMRY